MSKEEKKEKVEKVVTVVYKVNLHCPQCAHDIRKPLLKVPGVRSVDVKFESNEVTVEGTIDTKKIHERLEKWTKKKVTKVKETIAEEKDTKETEKETVKTTTIKVYMHCDQCEHDLKKKLIRHKGIYNVETDIKAQTVTIEGVIESENLLSYMQKRVHKHAEIIPSKEKKEEKNEEKEEEKKEEKNEEKKEEKKEEKNKEKKEEKKDEKNKEKKEEKEEEKKEEKKEEKNREKNEEKNEEKKEKATLEVKTTESTKIVEFEKDNKVEAKTKEDSVPYSVQYVYAPQFLDSKVEAQTKEVSVPHFVHYVYAPQFLNCKVEAKTKEDSVPYFVRYDYAPQFFSDENPNACSIM